MHRHILPGFLAEIHGQVQVLNPTFIDFVLKYLIPVVIFFGLLQIVLKHLIRLLRGQGGRGITLLGSGIVAILFWFRRKVRCFLGDMRLQTPATAIFFRVVKSDFTLMNSALSLIFLVYGKVRWKVKFCVFKGVNFCCKGRIAAEKAVLSAGYRQGGSVRAVFNVTGGLSPSHQYQDGQHRNSGSR